MKKVAYCGTLSFLAFLSMSAPLRADDKAVLIMPAADVPPAVIYDGPVFSFEAQGWGGYNLIAGATGTADPGGFEPLDSLAAYGGDARLALILPSGIYLQGDLIGESTTANDLNGNNWRSARTLGGHAGFRDAQNLIGAFGAIGITYSEFDNFANFRAYGLEFRHNWDNLSALGQLGYFDSTSDSGDGIVNNFINNGIFARGLLKYAISDSAALSGELSFASAHQGFGGAINGATIFGWGARYDQSFDSSPISAFLAYDGASYGNGIGSYVDNVVKVGLQIHFNSGGNNRFGHNADTLDLPNFGRWVGAGNSID